MGVKTNTGWHPSSLKVELCTVSVVVVPLYSAVLTWVMLRGRRGIKRHS